jgi:hypothetical protein
LRDLFFTVYKGGRGALGYGRPLAGGKTSVLCFYNRSKT